MVEYSENPAPYSILLLYLLIAPFANAQNIISIAKDHHQSAFALSERQVVIGSFQDEWDLLQAEGGSDLFVQYSVESTDFFGGPSIEMWLASHPQGTHEIGLLSFIGQLKKNRKVMLQSSKKAIAVVSVNSDSSEILGILEGEDLNYHSSHQEYDDLYLILSNRGALEYNNEILHQDSQTYFALLQWVETEWRVSRTIPYTGDIIISDIGVMGDSLYLFGAARGFSSWDTLELQSVTENYDGLLLADENPSDQYWDCLLAPGIGDGIFLDYLRDDYNQYVVGSFQGDIQVGEYRLEGSVNRNELFIYNIESDAFSQLKSNRFVQAIGHHVNEGRIILTGNFSGGLISDSSEWQCQGDFCSYIAILNRDLHLERMNILESTENVLIEESQLSNAILSVCGSFSGEWMDLLATSDDFFCIEYLLASTDVPDKVESRINIYPIPAAATLHIDTGQDLPDMAFIHSVLDSKWMRIPIYFDQINIQTLPSGIYILCLNIAGQEFRTKFIKT